MQIHLCGLEAKERSEKDVPMKEWENQWFLYIYFLYAVDLAVLMSCGHTWGHCSAEKTVLKISKVFSNLNDSMIL